MSDAPSLSPARCRIVLADDHPLFVQGLAAIVGKDHDVVGIATRLADLEAMLDELSPDLLITDLTFRNEGSLLGLMERGRKRQTIRCQFLVVTVHESRAHISEVYHAGAMGCLPKGVTGEELLDAIAAVSEGRRVFPPGVINELDHDVIPRRYQPSRLFDLDGILLTGREIAIMLELHSGLSRVAIGRKFSITPRTVGHHLAEIRSRLGINRPELLVRWINDHLDELRSILTTE